MHRAWARAVENGKGAGQHLGQCIGIQQRVAKARHTTDHLLLAGQFVQPPLP